jgi:hypothetical protein
MSMSIKVMTAVWAKSKQKGSALLLLLAIADHADETGKAYPSVDTLAEKIRMTPRNTQFLLRKLEESGELNIESNAGRHGCNLYRILSMGENISPSEGENISPEKITGGVKKLRGGGEKSRTKGVKALSPEPSLEPSKEPLSSEPKQLTAQQEYFGAVCKCVGYDPKVITKEQTGQVAQTVGVLQDAGYSIDDLRSFWAWWHKNDWRGQKGQLPTLPQLRSEIGKIRLPVTVTPANGSNGVPYDSPRLRMKDLTNG